ncbi:predicted protein, partial [Nematostella vectensis]
MDIQSILENLEELLTCRQCSNVFKNPRITPCLHSFCAECLNEIARSRPYQAYIACPTCKYEIRKPEGGLFNTLPPNFFLNRLHDIYVAKRRSYSDSNCGNCHRKVLLNSFCFACDTFMCEECLTAHNHKHKIIDIHDAANDHKMKIIDGNIKLKSKLKTVETGISNVEFKKMEVNEQIDYVKSDIKSRIESLVRTLKKHEEEMINELEKIRKDKQENLSFQLQMYETMHRQTMGAVVFTEDLLQRNMSEEILSIKNHMFERVNEILDTNVGVTPAENERVGYVANSEAYNGIQSVCLGHISTSLTEPIESTAEGEGLSDVSAGEEVYFTVTTRNAQGDVYYSEIDHVVVGVDSLMWGDVEASVKSLHNGHYEVKYIARVPGIYKIQVEIGGQHIKDSPFNVEVKQPVLTPVKSFSSHGMTKGKFLQPHGVAVSTIGQIVVSDSLKHHLQVFTPDGNLMFDFGGEGSDDGKFMHPMAIAFDKSEKCLYVADSDNNRIQVVDVKNGRFIRKFGCVGEGPGQFNGPCGVSVDGKGRVIVTDWNNNRVQVFSSEGKFLMKLGDTGEERIIQPRCALYHDDKEAFIVSDTGNNVIKVFDKNGKFSHVIGKPGSKRGELHGPRGLAIDKYQNIIVCDFENHRLQFFKFDGTVLSSFGTNGKGIGQFAFPLSISVVGGERVIVSDWGNNRIQIFK